ncbi:MAG TPA: hypothetical protein VF103_07325, partial [Polyangiaceae bacterium]
LEQVLIQRSLPNASDGDLQALHERIDALARKLESEKPAVDAYAASKWAAEYRAAEQKYVAFENSFVAFTVRVLGPEQSRPARAALRMHRAETLDKWSSP